MPPEGRRPPPRSRGGWGRGDILVLSQAAPRLQRPLVLRSCHASSLFGGDVHARLPLLVRWLVGYASAAHRRRRRPLDRGVRCLTGSSSSTSCRDADSSAPSCPTTPRAASSSASRHASTPSARVGPSSLWSADASPGPLCSSARRRQCAPRPRAWHSCPQLSSCAPARTWPAEHFLRPFADYTEFLADGFSRRQFHDGEPHQYRPLNHVYSSSDIRGLVGDRCQAKYMVPAATRHMTPDHSPMVARFLPPPVARRKAIHAWTARHPFFVDLIIASRVHAARLVTQGVPFSGTASITAVGFCVAL